MHIVRFPKEVLTVLASSLFALLPQNYAAIKNDHTFRFAEFQPAGRASEFRIYHAKGLLFRIRAGVIAVENSATFSLKMTGADARWTGIEDDLNRIEGSLTTDPVDVRWVFDQRGPGGELLILMGCNESFTTCVYGANTFRISDPKSIASMIARDFPDDH